MLGVMHKGVKRKLEDCEDPSLKYNETRQSIFNISMFKLQTFQHSVEPSLRRSVLVCNTLRSIEREFASEGIKLATLGLSHFLPSMHTKDMNLDSLPSADLDQTMTIPALKSAELRPPTNSALPSDKLITANGQMNLDGSWSENGVDNTEILWDKDRLSDINWNLLLTSHNFSSENVGTQNSENSLSRNLEPTNQDEIFGDIDLSLYDFDLLLPMSPPNVKLTPPITAEELLCSFSTDPPLTPLPTNGCYKKELLNEELDHIMHVLVSM